LLDCERKLCETRFGKYDHIRYFINKSQITVRQKKHIPKKDQEKLREIVKGNDSISAKFCAFVLIGKHKAAVDLLAANTNRGFIDGRPLSEVADWPISDLLNSTPKNRLRALASH
jgi:hypothetical protein